MPSAERRSRLCVPTREVPVSTRTATIGLSAAELRHELERELLLAMRAEGDAPTVHAVAHSIAQVIEHDHLRIAEQLERAGIRLGADAESDAS